MKKAAVINDLSSFGKCSLTAALPVLSALGVQCCPLATAVLTGQTGYPYYHASNLTEMIPHYTDAWLKNGVHFDAIYSGFITGEKQFDYIMEFLSHFREKTTLLLVDPIMGDDGVVFPMCTPAFLAHMRSLAQQADIITPNLTEACLLADIPPEQIVQCQKEKYLLSLARTCAEKLRSQAAVTQDIVITGIKCRDYQEPSICNYVLAADGETLNRSYFFDRSFSGTGDLFASVLCGCRTRGMRTKEAVRLAADFLSHSIADTVREQTDRNEGVNFEKFLGELILPTADSGKVSGCPS